MGKGRSLSVVNSGSDKKLAKKTPNPEKAATASSSAAPPSPQQLQKKKSATSTYTIRKVAIAPPVPPPPATKPTISITDADADADANPMPSPTSVTKRKNVISPRGVKMIAMSAGISKVSTDAVVMLLKDYVEPKVRALAAELGLVLRMEKKKVVKVSHVMRALKTLEIDRPLVTE